MSCSATSSYLALLPYCHNKSKLNIQDQLKDNLKSYNESDLQIWKPVISSVPDFTKIYMSALLKDNKEINCNCLQM